MKNPLYKGYLLVILSAAAFASTSLFLKLALGAGASVWGFTVLTAFFSLLPLLWMVRRDPGSGLPFSRWKGLLLFGLSGAVSAIAFNFSLSLLSISLATILLFTYPAFVALMAWAFLGQRPGTAHLIAVGLTFAGAAMTVDLGDAASGAVSLLGVGLALLTAVAHGTYMVVGERLALPALAATALVRGAILAGALLLRPQTLLELPSLPAEGWLIAVVSSAVAGVAPFLFLNKGLTLIGANLAAIASVSELPFALALGMLFQGDQIAPVQWAGAALITVAVVLSNRQAVQERGA